MAKLYKTAMGKQIDIDHLALTNETVIAVGNAKVNARGDELGPGGRIVKTRDQVMREYYALNTPVAADPIVLDTVIPAQSATVQRPQDQVPSPIADPQAAKLASFIAASVKSESDVAPIVIEEPIDRNLISGLDEVNTGSEAPVIEQSTSKEILASIPESVVETPAPTIDLPPVELPLSPAASKIRGTLASAVAKGATITQTPAVNPNKATGVQRF